MKKDRMDKIVELLKEEYGETGTYLLLTNERQIISGQIPDILTHIAATLKTLLDKGVPAEAVKGAVELPFKTNEELIEEAKRVTDEFLQKLSKGEQNGNNKQ